MNISSLNDRDFEAMKEYLLELMRNKYKRVDLRKIKKFPLSNGFKESTKILNEYNLFLLGDRR